MQKHKKRVHVPRKIGEYIWFELMQLDWIKKVLIGVFADRYFD